MKNKEYNVECHMLEAQLLISVVTMTSNGTIYIIRVKETHMTGAHLTDAT